MKHILALTLCLVAEAAVAQVPRRPAWSAPGYAAQIGVAPPWASAVRTQAMAASTVINPASFGAIPDWLQGFTDGTRTAGSAAAR